MPIFATHPVLARKTHHARPACRQADCSLPQANAVPIPEGESGPVELVDSATLVEQRRTAGGHRRPTSAPRCRPPCARGDTDNLSRGVSAKAIARSGETKRTAQRGAPSWPYGFADVRDTWDSCRESGPQPLAPRPALGAGARRWPTRSAESPDRSSPANASASKTKPSRTRR